jgi:hypothetical protein
LVQLLVTNKKVIASAAGKAFIASGFNKVVKFITMLRVIKAGCRI